MVMAKMPLLGDGIGWVGYALKEGRILGVRAYVEEGYCVFWAK